MSVTSPALSHTSTNNVPANSDSMRIFVVRLKDQFGNLTSGGHSSVYFTATGAGGFGYCDGYDVVNPCQDPQFQSGADVNNVPDGSVQRQLRGVLPRPQRGAPVLRLDQTATDDTSFGTGPQNLKVDWKAWCRRSPRLPRSQDRTTTDLTDSSNQNYYHQIPTHVVFSTLPKNTVGRGTVATVEANVKDQFNTGIPDQDVQFIRSGPNPNGTDCSTRKNSTRPTSSFCRFPFTCNTTGVQKVTVIVTEPGSNVEEGRGVQTVTFTGPSTKPKTEKPTLSAKVHKHHKVRLSATTHPSLTGNRQINFYEIRTAFST